jgi:uncharacterized membrane protein AbrB (regulator of aidB expression)
MTIFQKTGNPYALIPLFVLFYVLGAGIVLHDFYAFPSPTVLIGIIAAFLLFKSSTDEKATTAIAAKVKS